MEGKKKKRKNKGKTHTHIHFILMAIKTKERNPKIHYKIIRVVAVSSSFIVCLRCLLHTCDYGCAGPDHTLHTHMIA